MDLTEKLQDNIRLEKNKKEANYIFTTKIIPRLQEEFNFEDFIDYESEEFEFYKEYDQEFKIDFFTTVKQNNKELPIAIQARIGTSNGFTIRKTSRGHKAEFYTALPAFYSKNFPFPLDSIYSIQAYGYSLKDMREIYIADSVELYKLTHKLASQNKIKELTSQEGNKYYFLPIPLVKKHMEIIHIKA